jgi:anaerobic selenocysteine-containing dehydrogenase
MVHVVEGRVRKIEPNPWNPNNYSNISTDFFANYDPALGVRDGASICPKGNAGVFGLYDPDRVRVPMRRRNPEKGVDIDPDWEEISWDQAISEIAAKLGAIRDAGHPEELLWWSEDHSFTHPQQDFCALLPDAELLEPFEPLRRLGGRPPSGWPWATSARSPTSSNRSTSSCSVGTRPRRSSGSTCHA